MQQGLNCYSLRCDLFKVPEKTSGFVDTGASRVALGLSLCLDMVHDHLDLLPKFITFDYF